MMSECVCVHGYVVNMRVVCMYVCMCVCAYTHVCNTCTCLHVLEAGTVRLAEGKISMSLLRALFSCSVFFLLLHPQ